MKLSISEDASVKLKNLLEKVQKMNPYAQKSLSTLGDAIISEFVESGTDVQVLGVANRLTTSKGKKRSLIKMVKNLAASGSEETLKNLEKTLKKLEQPKSKISQNSS